MRPRRLLLGAALALGLAPGTFVRSAVPARTDSAAVAVRPLAVPRVRAGPLVLAGAWELTSADREFGGYSAMVATAPGEFLAVSDQGRTLRLPRPDRQRDGARTGAFRQWGRAHKWQADVEGLARDPATGRLWTALERSNTIAGFERDLTMRRRVSPAAMADWGDNSGPEAFARLADGRFVAFEETARAGTRHRAALFAGDPLEGGRASRFFLKGMPGYRPSDAAVLPDGRLVILWRAIDWGLPPRFPAALSVSRVGKIRPGRTLPWALVARLDAPVPLDNYEGLAITAEPGGAAALWLISDDNLMQFQRTLVLKLLWPGASGIPQHGEARRPS